ncbi:flavin reductase family protein [Streptomyces sp. WM6386]|uniref:flavin reductase family protein n=1 Tax=Streptomyces sp. WM6386 TaxID=1415558 RepID=UPI0006960FA9|nr:flavin reductase family protein [Streptomyces sp. WM6386]
MTVVRPIINPALLRSVAGRFPTGVTVITTATSTGPAGFTCQSFTSLSVDPPPISFNVSRSSDTWPPVREAGRFCVSILAADQQDTARAFARRHTDRFAGIAHSCLLGNGTPRLSGATAWLEATVEDTYAGGDHLVVLGRVTAAIAGEREEALLFHRAAPMDRPVPRRKG